MRETATLCPYCGVGCGLLVEVREGRVAPDTRTVFLHTGGMPALFAATYASWVVR